MEKIKQNGLVVKIAIAVLVILVIIFALMLFGRMQKNGYHYSLNITETKWTNSGKYEPTSKDVEIKNNGLLDYKGCYNENVEFEVLDINKNSVKLKASELLIDENNNSVHEFTIEKDKKNTLKTNGTLLGCTYELTLK